MICVCVCVSPQTLNLSLFSWRFDLKHKWGYLYPKTLFYAKTLINVFLKLACQSKENRHTHTHTQPYKNKCETKMFHIKWHILRLTFSYHQNNDKSKLKQHMLLFLLLHKQTNECTVHPHMQTHTHDKKIQSFILNFLTKNMHKLFGKW